MVNITIIISSTRQNKKCYTNNNNGCQNQVNNQTTEFASTYNNVVSEEG